MDVDEEPFFPSASQFAHTGATTAHSSSVSCFTDLETWNRAYFDYRMHLVSHFGVVTVDTSHDCGGKSGLAQEHYDECIHRIAGNAVCVRSGVIHDCAKWSANPFCGHVEVNHQICPYQVETFGAQGAVQCAMTMAVLDEKKDSGWENDHLESSANLDGISGMFRQRDLQTLYTTDTRRPTAKIHRRDRDHRHDNDTAPSFDPTTFCNKWFYKNASSLLYPHSHSVSRTSPKHGYFCTTEEIQALVETASCVVMADYYWSQLLSFEQRQAALAANQHVQQTMSQEEEEENDNKGAAAAAAALAVEHAQWIDAAETMWQQSLAAFGAAVLEVYHGVKHHSTRLHHAALDTQRETDVVEPGLPARLEAVSATVRENLPRAMALDLTRYIATDLCAMHELEQWYIYACMETEPSPDLLVRTPHAAQLLRKTAILLHAALAVFAVPFRTKTVSDLESELGELLSFAAAATSSTGGGGRTHSSLHGFGLLQLLFRAAKSLDSSSAFGIVCRRFLKRLQEMSTDTFALPTTSEANAASLLSKRKASFLIPLHPCSVLT